MVERHLLLAGSFGQERVPVRPDPEEELQQAIDENEVAAMIWELSQQPDIDPSVLVTALASPLLGDSPFGRGYTRHSWTVDEQCVRNELEDLAISAPTFADFLDALQCLDVPTEQVDAVTQPAAYYPYEGGPERCP